MTLVTETLATLTIPSGQTLSPTLGSLLSRGQLRTALSFLDNLTIMAPSGLDEDTQVQISSVRNPAYTDWVDGLDLNVSIAPADQILDELTNAITDEASVNLYTQGLGSGGPTQLNDLSFKDLRLKSAVAVAADRNFAILAKMDIPSGV